MNSSESTASARLPGPGSVDFFLRADARDQSDWVVRCPGKLAGFCFVVIVGGAGCYGAVMGSWHDPLQALCTGIKLPLVILLTSLGNGLLNGMLAPLLGLDLKFRQSLTIVLVSFALASLVLAGLSPVALFIVWNTPPLAGGTSVSSPEYGFLQLVLVAFISIAGVIGVVRMLPLLRQWTGRSRIALRILFAWLAANLFLGSQISWVLRPYIWDPAGRVAFLGHDCLRGSFYETVFEAARRMIF